MKNMIYNALKLSEYRPLFHDKKVLVIGAGAVGTCLMEKLTKMGVSPDAMDFDTFTLENAAKHSCLVRTPEDVNKNKAVCTAERVQVLLDEGCSSNGIDGDICKIGPEALAGYDAVIVAVDNFDAKLLLNELVRKIPEERRPVVIMDGTFDEMAQSVILDNKEFCLDCLIDESWKKDSSIRTSCSGPQLRQIDGVAEIVRTSNMASDMAANLSAEQFRAYVIGDKNVMNRRITYTAYPHLELSVVKPMRKRNCPGCSVKPPKHIEWLEGNVLEKTLRNALTEIGERIGTDDFEISVYLLNYRKIMYGGFITDDVCHCCGKPMQVMKHEGRTYLEDMVCEACAAKGKHPFNSTEWTHGRVLRAFTHESDEVIKDMTLYELGYPLGAHIEVLQRNGAMDFLDEDKIVTTVFSCADDAAKMHSVHKL